MTFLLRKWHSDFNGHFRRCPIGVDPKWFDGKVMKKLLPEIEKLERGDPEGFDSYIETFMSTMIPQPQTDQG
jgi:hypothetical protein